MSHLQRYSGFRGGVIAAASGLTPSTVASWGLKIGNNPDVGHPRYDGMDVLSVLLMKELTRAVRVTAERASSIVNSLRPLLTPVVERMLADNASSGGWKWEGGPYIVARAGADREDDLTVEILEQRGFTEALEQDRSPSLIVLPVRVNVNRAILAMQVYIENDPILRAAFADSGLGQAETR